MRKVFGWKKLIALLFAVLLLASCSAGNDEPTVGGQNLAWDQGNWDQVSWQ